MQLAVFGKQQHESAIEASAANTDVPVHIGDSLGQQHFEGFHRYVPFSRKLLGLQGVVGMRRVGVLVANGVKITWEQLTAVLASNQARAAAVKAAKGV